MEICVEFQQRFRKLRKDNGYSLEVLGSKLGLSKSVLSYYENGKRFPNLSTLKKISDLFDVSFDYLVGNDIRVVNDSTKETIHMSDGEVSFIKEIRKYDYAHDKMTSEPERSAKILDKSLKENK